MQPVHNKSDIAKRKKRSGFSSPSLAPRCFLPFFFFPFPSAPLPPSPLPALSGPLSNRHASAATQRALFPCYSTIHRAFHSHPASCAASRHRIAVPHRCDPSRPAPFPPRTQLTAPIPQHHLSPPHPFRVPWPCASAPLSASSAPTSLKAIPPPPIPCSPHSASSIPNERFAAPDQSAVETQLELHWNRAARPAQSPEADKPSNPPRAQQWRRAGGPPAAWSAAAQASTTAARDAPWRRER